MSLVENIARKNYQPYELFKNVKQLRDNGYNSNEIAEKQDWERITSTKC